MTGDAELLVATQNFVRGNVTPELTEQLSEGAVIVNFQGHGNRTLMTHESLMQTGDLAAIENDGKPFIFMGYSCQLARFHLLVRGRVRGLHHGADAEQLVHAEAPWRCSQAAGRSTCPPTRR